MPVEEPRKRSHTFQIDVKNLKDEMQPKIEVQAQIKEEPKKTNNAQNKNKIKI